VHRRILLVIGLVVAATVAVTALVTTQRHVTLPVPHPVTGEDIKANRHVSSPTTTLPISIQLAAPGAGPHQPLTVVDQQHPGASSLPPPVDGAVYRFAPSTVFHGCAVAVSDPSPPAGHTEQTVTVLTAPGAVVRLHAAYPNTTTARSGMADGNGVLQFPLGLRSSPVGVPVVVSVTASFRNHLGTCQTAFTPQG